MKNKPIVAIMYDFDKTLSCDDMQNFGFVPSLNMTPAEFWSRTQEVAEKEGLEKGCVSLQDLKRYQGKSKQIFGFPIHEIKKVDYPIRLETLKIKRPPQSWCYIKEKI